MITARNVPGFIAVEPDQARDHVLNMIRQGVQFVCEIDPTLKGFKDCIVLSRSALLETEPQFTDLRQRATTLDDACHFALNCIRSELTFQCNPTTRPNDDKASEWLFLVRLRAEGRTGA